MCLLLVKRLYLSIPWEAIVSQTLTNVVSLLGTLTFVIFNHSRLCLRILCRYLQSLALALGRKYEAPSDNRTHY